eukprot:SAG22_NODE_66_length_22936_cov_626.714279_3_plen_42_part_00
MPPAPATFSKAQVTDLISPITAVVHSAESTSVKYNFVCQAL